MSGPTTATLGLAPTEVALRAIGPWLARSVGGLDPATARSLLPRMELAVHETCMNVVHHAALSDGEQIELVLTLDPDHLTVYVRDSGAAFDQAGVPEPAGGQLRERGYGVKIARSLVDELTYRRQGSRNELALRIDLEGPP